MTTSFDLNLSSKYGPRRIKKQYHLLDYITALILI